MPKTKKKHAMTDKDIQRIEKSKGKGDEELPEGYQHPVASEIQDKTLTVDDLPFGKQREQEIADSQPEAIAKKQEAEAKKAKKE